MKKTAIAACVLALSVAGAWAQSSNTTPNTTSNPGNAAPGANTGSPTSGTTTGSSNPAVNPGDNAPSGVNASGQATIVSLSALERGANSFTEGQARTRLEGAGLSNVTNLQKDDQGIWRGQAMHQGRNVTVGFDYKGNIGVQ
jgi:transcription elongation factor